MMLLGLQLIAFCQNTFQVINHNNKEYLLLDKQSSIRLSNKLIEFENIKLQFEQCLTNEQLLLQINYNYSELIIVLDQAIDIKEREIDLYRDINRTYIEEVESLKKEIKSDRKKYFIYGTGFGIIATLLIIIIA